jgi:hypothetical protein
MQTGHQHVFIQSFLDLCRLLPTTHKKPSAQIGTYDAEDTFQRLKSHDHEFTLNHLLEFGSNAMLQKLRNLDLSLSPRLSLRRDNYAFEFHCGVWTH